MLLPTCHLHRQEEQIIHPSVGEVLHRPVETAGDNPWVRRACWAEPRRVCADTSRNGDPHAAEAGDARPCGALIAIGWQSSVLFRWEAPHDFFPNAVHIDLEPIKDLCRDAVSLVHDREQKVPALGPTASRSTGVLASEL